MATTNYFYSETVKYVFLTPVECSTFIQSVGLVSKLPKVGFISMTRQFSLLICLQKNKNLFVAFASFILMPSVNRKLWQLTQGWRAGVSTLPEGSKTELKIHQSHLWKNDFIINIYNNNNKCCIIYFLAHSYKIGKTIHAFGRNQSSN